MAPRSRGILGCPDRLPTAREVCDGEAGFWVNLLLFPFVLLWNATSIYIIPCFQVLGRRFYRAFCRSCVDSCCGPWVFTDTEFEGPAAIGTSGGQQADWVRAVDLLADKKDANGKPLKPKLYEGGITPGDLAQGAVGDCWLVAALACVAEYPDAIRKVFLTPEYNSRGIYRVRLFDATKGAWVVVTVDDRIPCKPGTKQPLFMKLQGCELWAVLLEKAFAKFCGSYGALDGGWAMWGWRALTGDNVFRLRLDGDQVTSRRSSTPAAIPSAPLPSPGPRLLALPPPPPTVLRHALACTRVLSRAVEADRLRDEARDGRDRWHLSRHAREPRDRRRLETHPQLHGGPVAGGGCGMPDRTARSFS